jgi:hypothetical protein
MFLLFSGIGLGQVPISSGLPAHEPEEQQAVAMLLADGGHAPLYGFVETLVSRLGDRAAVGVIQYLGERKVTVTEDAITTDEIRRILLVIRIAFATPTIIATEENRNPRAAMILLKYLSCLPSSTLVKGELESANNFLEQTKAALNTKK